MKIAIDFDDVIVDTMDLFMAEWNKGRAMWHPKYLVRNMVNNWNLPLMLSVPDEEVRDVFEVIDYDHVNFFPDAVASIRNMKDDGHKVVILTSNRRLNDIRNALNDHGLQEFSLIAGVGHKSGWCRDNDVDVLIEDRPTYLKGAVTVGIHAIRFIQPWNKMSEGWGSNSKENAGLKHNASNWKEVYRVVSQINTDNLLDAVSKIRLGKMTVVGGVKLADGSNIETRHTADEVVTNSAGAKQTKIAGDYTLLPPLAIKEIAIVLEEGAAKYGVGNWEKLSIAEILNHVYAHLFEYQQEPTRDELSHAACRILMALQLHLEKLDKQGPLGA